MYVYIHIITKVAENINTFREVYILIIFSEKNIMKMEVLFRIRFFRGFGVTVNDAVVKRIVGLLAEKQMTQYRLEQLSGIQHGHMQWIMSGKSKTVTFSTVLRLANGFGMTVVEFLNDDTFLFENLDIE